MCVRNAVVCRLIQKISKRFEAEGFPWPDLTGENQITCVEDTCILCEGTGRVVLPDGRVMFDLCPVRRRSVFHMLATLGV